MHSLHAFAGHKSTPFIRQKGGGMQFGLSVMAAVLQAYIRGTISFLLGQD